MKMTVFALGFLCATICRAQSDVYFLPCEAKASVSFEGTTQEGKEIHRLEVRRLAYVADPARGEFCSNDSCVIYYAGLMYGPKILKVMEALDPLVLQSSKDVVDIYFLCGAHTHIHQRWKLLGHTAQLEKEEEIDWEHDPRMKRQSNQPPQPTPTAITPAVAQPVRQP
jgi:hypothetical protein